MSNIRKSKTRKSPINKKKIQKLSDEIENDLAIEDEQKDKNNEDVEMKQIDEEDNNNIVSEIKKGGKLRRTKSRTTTPNRNHSQINNKIIDDSMSENEEEKESSDKEEEEIQFLPCREVEQKRIYNYIKEGLQTNGAYSSLYIAGLPGTGKTVSVLTVLKMLEQEAKQKKIATFNELYINGMKFTNPSNVFKSIYNFIFEDQKNQNIKKYIQILDTFFKNREDYNYKPILNNPSNPHLILIIDEVDCLINQKQNLLYNIFNWTTYSKSKLIVLSISNTIDLPNRLLPKIQSRMGTNKLVFKPYIKDELYKIISVKIEDVHLFSEDALKLSSMKVAAVNGDLRRILQICKRAKELYVLEKQNNRHLKKIEKKHIIQACNELFDSKLVKVIKSLQILEKLIIATILYSIKLTNDNKVKIPVLFNKKDMFLNKANENVKNNFLLTMNWEEFQMIIYNLVNLKIISFSDVFNENFIDNYVCIRFYTDEFMNAVEEQTEYSEVFQYLSTLLNDK